MLYPTFQLPCGKCIECRLEYARQKAIRAIHESRMHVKNSFITLTYSDDSLFSDRLQLSDFQNFMKRLRITSSEQIGVMYCGEYGSVTKRPHWHAILFGWCPDDSVYKYTNDHGDRVFTSEDLTDLWGYGNCEFGNVSFKSAGYVARYAAKKLEHGHDGSHRYDPIFRMSSRYAIGKRFLEVYWRDIFSVGYCILDTGSSVQKCSIPRYYVDWLKKHHPLEWESYVTRIKLPRAEEASIKASLISKDYYLDVLKGNSGFHSPKLQRRILSLDRHKRFSGSRKGFL